MTLTLIFIDMIFVLLFNIPIYSISLIFILYKKYKLIIPLIFSAILDFFMNKISLTIIALTLSIINIKFIKNSNLIKIILLLIFNNFIIHIYLEQLDFFFIIKSILLIIIYLGVIRIYAKHIN